jgi:hypothetical protein
MPTGPDPWCSLPRAQGKVFTHRVHCLSKRANVLFSDQTPTSLRHRNEAKAGSSHGGGMVQCAWGLRRLPCPSPLPTANVPLSPRSGVLSW